MTDELNFNYIYKLVVPWFDSKDDARRWYKNEILPSFGFTPRQVVEDFGIVALEEWIEAKKLGCFE